MLFDDWSGLLRVLIVGTSAYVGLVTLLRFTGKRTLSKMNAFDMIVTVALGSTLATVLLSSDVALAEGRPAVRGCVRVGALARVPGADQGAAVAALFPRPVPGRRDAKRAGY
jgi:hypothetical protein